MKNNIIGFIVYLSATALLSAEAGVLLLAMKENSDRCHYYNGSWSKTGIAIGLSAVFIGQLIRCFFPHITTWIL